jgi:hypothetical protein
VTRRALTCVNVISRYRQLRFLVDPWNPSVTVVRRAMLHVECTPQGSGREGSPRASKCSHTAPYRSYATDTAATAAQRLSVILQSRPHHQPDLRRGLLRTPTADTNGQNGGHIPQDCRNRGAQDGGRSQTTGPCMACKLSGPRLARARRLSRRRGCGTTAGNSGDRIDPVHVTVVSETYSDHGGSRASAERTGGSDARIW